jgi:TetR/AcrR family transcriptional repressor of nem operon
VLRRAQAEGILDPAADARALARFYLGVAKGIGVLHKVFGDASALRDIVKIAMSKWPYPAGKRGARKRNLLG